MKIAFLTTYDFAVPGGVRNHILHLSTALRKLGHSTYIIAPSSKPLDLEYFITIATFPNAAKTAFIPPHLLVGFKAMFRLRRILNSAAFDVVHIHEPLLPPLCISALFHKKTPLFATFHTYYELGQPMYRLFQPIMNYLLKRLKGRIAVSHSAKTYIERYFPYDYQIIPNGVDIETFSSPKVLPTALASGYFNLLFVGHAQFKRKGLGYLLAAYRLLKPEYPKLRLIIAGARWIGRDKPKELEDTDLADVLYLGTVDDPHLIALYQTANIFCAPSTGNESFGMVLIEAMAAGTPVVATQIDGYLNVVRNEKEALLVPPKDSFALAQAIRTLIENPRLAQQLVEQGKERVLDYSWSKIAKEVLDYYGCKLK